MKQAVFVLLVSLFTSPVCGQTVTKIFIVRHADRTADDDLTPAGLARAQTLKRVLGGAGIKQIHSTDFVRTKKTAKPLADSLGLTTAIYSSIPHLVTQIKTTGAGLRHLVVAHSDTVDDMIAECGCRPPASITPQMPTTQFDNLFLVLLKKTGAVWSCEWMRLRYGTPTD